jgi:hypothetical protein
MPFEKTKEGHIENLKDLSCMGQKSYDANRFLGEKSTALAVTWHEQSSINARQFLQPNHSKSEAQSDSIKSES